MYKLFAAAQAIEFSVGCQAKCSNFEVESNEFPLASTPEVSAPVEISLNQMISDLWFDLLLYKEGEQLQVK